MPIKCYTKPNRLTKRVFTEKDAARVLCYVAKDGVIDLSGVFDQFQVCGEEVARNAVEKYVKVKICELFGEQLTKVLQIITRLLLPIRNLIIFVDASRGFIQDIRNFSLFGVGVPETLLLPFSNFIDSVATLLTELEVRILDVTDILTQILGGCENGKGENK